MTDSSPPPDDERPSDQSSDEPDAPRRDPSESPDVESDSGLMESTVESIEEALAEPPSIRRGRSNELPADDSADAGESKPTKPFGIDLDQTVAGDPNDATLQIDAAPPQSPDASTEATVAKLEETHQLDSLDDTSSEIQGDDASATISLGTGKTQAIAAADKTVRLEDTADQNALEATVQFDSQVIGEETVVRFKGDDDAAQGGTVAIDHRDIGQTVNPRELSDKDAAFWGSLLQSGSGQIAKRGEVTEISPAIERSISETKLQIRVREMLSPKQPADAESDYRLVQLLGKGGMGNVFVAKQSSLDRLIAVKVIKPLEKKKREKLAAQGRLEEVEEDRRQQFLSEAVVTGDLDHPNIVPIHDIAVTADNTLFYAMKRVVGTPWSKVIDEKSRDENLDILLRVSDAIGFAHTRGVVHRDIKPENIMLGDFGVVLVMDWGLALAKPEFEKIDSISHTAGLGGTPAFMAPEMATGPMQKIGPASDIYLLGATLFLIITGRPPHQAPNITQCIKAVAENEISGDLDSYRGELLNIALKAMAKEPGDRYEDVRAFQQSIREYRSHAESIALANRAENNAEQGREQHDYSCFSRATYGFQQALSLWPGNEPAQRGIEATKISHAEAALAKEDFDLGLSLLSQTEPAHQELIQQLVDGQRERDLRQSRLTLFKRAAAAMLLFIMLGGAVAFYYINQARDAAVVAQIKAEDQELRARKQRRIADTERDRAEAKTKEVELEKENVIKQTKLAEAERKKADIARAEAVANANEAIKNGEAAERNARTAEEKTKLANKNLAEANKQRGIAISKAREAEYEVYLSQIGLAKAKIDQNEFDDARRILTELSDARDPSRLGWEWRWLWRQSNQSAFALRTDRALVGMDLSDDDRHGVVVLENGTIRLLDVAVDGRVSMQEDGGLSWEGALEDITAAAISADGRRIAIGNRSGEIQLWESSPPRMILQFDGHEQEVSELRFADAERLVSGSLDRTVRIWDAKNREPRSKLWHIAPVRKIATAVGRDRSLLIAVAVADGASGRAVVWRAGGDGAKSDPRRIGEFDQHDQPLASIALSPDGQLAASGDVGGNVLIWRPLGSRSTDFQAAISKAIKQVGGKANGRDAKSIRSQVVARLSDPSLSLENKQLVSTTKRNTASSKAHGDYVESIKFSSDGRRLLTTAHDYTIKVWDVKDRRINATLRGHGGWVTDATFAGLDGDRVLSVSKDASVRSWNIRQSDADIVFVNQDSGKRGRDPSVDQSQPHDDEIWSARFDPTGTRIVSASRDHTARVLEIDRKTMRFREIAKLQLESQVSDASDAGLPDLLSEGTSFRAMSVAVDRANGHVFVGSADASVRIWDLVRGTQIGQLRGTGLNSSLALSSNGRLLLTGSSSPDYKAIVWGIDPSGLTPAKKLFRLKGHQQAVTALAISPDGRRLFTGDRIGLGYFWDTATGQRIGSPVEECRGYRINDARFSHDGNKLLVAADDQNLTRIDVPSGRRIDRLPHDGFVTRIALSNDGRRVLTISESSTRKRFESDVTLWDLTTRAKQIVDQISALRDVAAKSNGDDRANAVERRFLSAGFDSQDQRAIISRFEGDRRPGRLTLIDLSGERANRKSARQLQLPRRLGAAEVALALPGEHLLTLNSDAAFLWDMKTMTHRKSYRAHAALTQASFSFDGKYIATGSRSLKIWDAKTGAAIGKLESPHQGAVRSVQFSRQGPNHLVATAGEDGKARLWQWKPLEKAFVKQAEFSLGDDLNGIARTVCISDDGRRIVVAGDNGRARVWSLVNDGAPLVLDQPDHVSFTSADFSPDGKWVALGGDDKQARLFAVAKPDANPARAIIMEGHADVIEDIAVIQDGSQEMRILTGSLDKTARVWDPRVGSDQDRAREILTLRRHTLGVTAVDVSRDGNIAMTASRDGSVILWPAAKRLPASTDHDDSRLFDDLMGADE
ncbi:WD40 repeat domain-containing serine/threonine protein kinase [Planctomycetes bacterium K23_9]|uniref:Serine/threonine-protein kinase PknD n=1 Tax=Stieleria marina TaxID=1930275 RepID=A0A517NYJ5_9BACT|nr:Serine/threonine-protein kinase PknD [Planctomycetes bacterium K23_9]